jgi:hypothetical protein
MSKKEYHHPEQPAVAFYEHAAMTAIKMAEQLQQEGLLPRFEDMQTDEEQQRAYVDQLDRLYERLCLNQGLPWPPPRNGQEVRKLLAPRFSLGEIVATPGAIELLKQAEKAPAEYLLRHVQGDWGEDLPEEDIQENEFSVEHGFRLLSSYPIPETEERLWIITEHDRSVTTLLKPDEY